MDTTPLHAVTWESSQLFRELDVGSGKGREQTDIATERIVGKVVTEREGERKDGAYMWVNIRHDWKG